MKQREYFGFNSIINLWDILKKEKSKNIFLVTGKRSYVLSGAKKGVERIFQEIGIDYTRFSDFTPNPKIEQIQTGLNLFNQQNYDTIVAVGGGSPIDVAKAIKLFSLEKSPERKLPLVAIPTTAGSGSEATHFIVYYIGKEKQSKGNPNLTLPNYTICDPQFTMSLPKNIAASTGIDALGQAVESYWSINSTPKSQEFSRQAINLLMNNLEQAVNNLDKDPKKNVMRAANLAGKAINITKTTACHSISYPITSYFGILHGHAASLTLGEILIYNSKINKGDCLDKRGVKYVKKTINELTNLIGENNSYEAKNKIQNLMQKIGLEIKLSQLSLKEGNINIIIKKGFNPQRVKNNPRLLTKKNLKKILKNIY